MNGALYDFGYGLSYTSFEYSDMRLSSASIFPTDSVKVSFSVTNIGKVSGDEVVQLYVEDCLTSLTAYEKVLRGFERISLEPGETKTVEFLLTPKDLSLLDKNMHRVVEPGDFMLMAGASSTDIRLKARLSVLDPAAVSNGLAETSLSGASASGEAGRDALMTLCPASLGNGDFLTVPANGVVRGVRFMLSGGSDAEVSVQITNGGGQFLTVASARRCVSGMNEIVFPASAASELRLVVGKGRVTVENIDVYFEKEHITILEYLRNDDNETQEYHHFRRINVSFCSDVGFCKRKNISSDIS